MTGPTCLEVALRCAAAGWVPVPLVAWRDEHGHAMLTPPRGFTFAGRDVVTEDEVRAWWSRRSFDGVAVRTCAPRGPRAIVVDLDVPSPAKPDRHDGRVGLAALERAHGALPDTWTVESPSGGLHYWLTVPTEVRVRSTQSELAPGVDVIGAGSIGRLPPTRRHDGAYRAVRRHGRLPAPAPGWLLELVATQVRPKPRSRFLPAPRSFDRDRGDRALTLAAARIACAPEGTRQGTASRMAYWIGGLVAAGQVAESEALPILEDAAVHAGLPTREAHDTVRRGLAAGSARPIGGAA